jgi:hypothetical protein
MNKEGESETYIPEVVDENAAKKEPESGAISRRGFLKKLAMGGIGLALTGARVGMRQWEHTIENYLEQEKKPKSPDVSVRFFFSAHSSGKDLHGLQEEVLSADVVTLEDIGWMPEDLAMYQKVSDGTMSPEQGLATKMFTDPGRRDVENERLRAIYNSHKTIAMIDVPQGHPLEKEIHEIEPGFAIGTTFDETLLSIQNYYRREAEVEKKREEYILSRLEEVIQEQALHKAQTTPPKKKLNILVSIGSVHTSMLHTLKKKEVHAEAKFNVEPGQPYRYGFADEIYRRNVFEKSPDDRLAAKVFLQTILVDFLGAPPTDDTGKADRFLRKFIDGFDQGEIVGMFDRLPKDDTKKWRTTIAAALRERGLFWPERESEIDDFLDIRRSAGQLR